MLGLLKKTFRNSFIYSLGNLSNRLAGFVLLPIYTTQLTTAEYGIYGIAEATVFFIATFFGLALYQALFRWFYDKDFINKQKQVFFNVLFVVVISAGLLLLVLSLLKTELAEIVFSEMHCEKLFLLLIFSAALEIIIQIPNTLLRLQERAVLFVISNLLRLTISLSLTVYFLVYQQKKVDGIYEAMIYSQIANLIFLLLFLFKNIKLHIDIKLIKSLLIYSYPLALSAVFAALMQYTDRYVLNYFGTLNDVGVYSLGYKIANSIQAFIVTSVNLALMPMMFKSVNEPNHQRYISKILTYYAYGLMIFILFVSLYSKEIIKVLAQHPNYWSSYYIVPLIAVAIYFSMLKDVTIIGLHISKKTKIISKIIIIASVTNIIINIPLTYFFNNYGAAIAVIITQIVYFILIYNSAQKQYFLPYELKKILLILGVGVIIIVIAFLFNDYSLPFRLVLKFILIILFPVILYLFKFYEPIEILTIKKGLKKFKFFKK